MKHLLITGLLAAMAGTGALAEAHALGQLPVPPGDRTVPTPAPIAGGGVLWLGIAAGAGLYLWIRRRRGRD